MPMQRRHLFRALPLLAAGSAWAQPVQMTRASAPAKVQAGAGTQDGVTTGSSGPQKDDGQDGAATGTTSSTQPGGDGSSGNSPPSVPAPPKGRP